MKVKTPLHVRYAETDMMGVVYHANYLLYFEDARMDYLRELGFPYEEIEKQGIMSPVHDVSMVYHRPLRFGESAFVLTSVVSNRPTRTVFLHQVFRDDMDPEVDMPLVSCEVTICLVSRPSFQLLSVKRALPALYEAYDRALEPRPEGRL